MSSETLIKEGYLRISEVLRFFTSFAGIDAGVLEAKALVGTNVHKAIECYFNNVFYPLTEKEENYFQSFLKWQEKSGIVPTHKEIRLYDTDLMITGQVDMIASVNNKSALFDFKTSAVKSEKIWALQGAFYFYLARRNKLDVGDSYFFVHLKNTGACAHICDFTFTEELWNVCKSAVTLYRYFNKS